MLKRTKLSRVYVVIIRIQLFLNEMKHFYECFVAHFTVVCPVTWPLSENEAGVECTESLYHSRVNCSLTSTQRPGHKAHNCKLKAILGEIQNKRLPNLVIIKITFPNHLHCSNSFVYSLRLFNELVCVSSGGKETKMNIVDIAQDPSGMQDRSSRQSPCSFVVTTSGGEC